LPVAGLIFLEYSRYPPDLSLEIIMNLHALFYFPGRRGGA
jgi:hypothetical protein